MKSTKKKLLQTPAAKKRRAKYAAKWVTEHPAIPEGVKPAKKNQYHERLGVKKSPSLPASRSLSTKITVDGGGGGSTLPAHNNTFITGFMVIGLGILCWTAYQLAYLFATPCVCP